MTKKHLRAILFDHDGTLVNSEPVHFKIWETVLHRHGVTLPEHIFNTHYAGIPTLANAIDLVSRYGINLSPASLAEEKNKATRAYLTQQAYPLMPDVALAITELRNMGLILAVVTGANNYSVGATLKAYNFEHYFSLVVSADDVQNSKPAPDCYLLALEKLGLAADECLAIEDTAHGLEAATRAGLRCLAVPTEESKHHDFNSAIAVVDGMSTALNYVKKMRQ